MKNPPKITIVVAVFNGATTLKRCLKSIYSQSYVNKELIVIDGGSTDDSVKIIKDHSHSITYWESKPDRGIYYAWNKALTHSTGEWVCFLGADDYFWQNDVLEKMIPTIEIAQKEQIRLVYGRVASINKIGKVQNILGMPWEKQKSIALHQMPPHPGLLHHSSIFADRGKFDESFHIAADYELLLRELKDGDAKFASEVIVAGVQYGGISCSIQHLMRLIVEDIAARKKNGIKSLTINTVKYYIALLFNALFY